MHPTNRSKALAAAALAAAGALSGGTTIVSSADTIARSQAQTTAADVTKDRAPSALHKAGTDLASPSRWQWLRSTRYRYPAPGWPVAVDRRRAKKARNVARNRRAQRGAR